MKKLFIVCLAGLFLTACTAGIIKPTALCSFNMTNAVIGDNAFMVNNAVNNAVNALNYSQLSLIAGETKVSLTSIKAPTYAYYSSTIPTMNGSYYSLFLTGIDTAHVQSVLIKETFSNYTDSVAGVRFINLSPDSSQISVNIAASPNASEVSNLAYLGYTPFKKYAANAKGITYRFEFRDATSGTLITAYNLTVPIFRNVTLALAGTNNNPKVIVDKDY